MGKRLAFEGSHGIVEQQSLGFVFAKAIGDRVKRKLQLQWAARGVVRITGNKVHQALCDPRPSIFLRARAKNSGERTCGDLHVATKLDPLEQALWLGAKYSVALGMCDDGAQSGQLQFVQSLVHRWRDGKFVELDEKIVLLINAVLRNVAANGANIFRAEVEIAAGGQREATIKFFR